MQIKACLRKGAFPLVCVALVLAIWGVARCIPSEMRQTRWERVAANLTLETPIAEVCAEVKVELGVTLREEDVLTWRRLCLQGMSPAEALRIVVHYRGAAEP